jgi:hypothetical protein
MRAVLLIAGLQPGSALGAADLAAKFAAAAFKMRAAPILADDAASKKHDHGTDEGVFDGCHVKLSCCASVRARPSHEGRLKARAIARPMADRAHVASRCAARRSGIYLEAAAAARRHPRSTVSAAFAL